MKRHYHPSITSARRVFRDVYSDGNLTFEQFLTLTSKNCHYCNAPPSNKANAFKHKKDASKYARDNGDFIYSGLDRINNSLPHNIDNILPSCETCNYAKRLMDYNLFLNHVIKIVNNLNLPLDGYVMAL